VAAVKLEGGKVRKNTVKAIVEAGIPVIGHIGLTPQTASFSGGFKVQGKTAAAAAAIFEDALALQEAGCSALVLELVPELLGQAVTKGVSIPTFGIGAGRFTSGQVLVYHDMLGMYPNFTPKFCKQYVNAGEEITKGLTAFKNEVENQIFPAPSHTFSMKLEEWQKAHDLILASHPNKEGVDGVVASALAQVKASLEVESLKTKEATGSNIATSIEKATSVEKLTIGEKPASGGKAILVNSTTSSEKPIQTQKISPSTKSQPSKPSFSLPLAPPQVESQDFTNFDVYYNSYFNNNEEGEEDEIARMFETTHKNSVSRKMKA